MGSAQSALKRAIDYLGAVEVAPERYAWDAGRLFGYRPPSWYVASGADLESFAVALDTTEGPIIPGAKMPSWWTPEQRFAWRVKQYGFIGNEQKAAREDNSGTLAQRFPALLPYFERITASLETGEEVPA